MLLCVEIQTRTMSDFLPLNIKFLRRKMGLTQEKLADLLGTTRASVCAYEDGRAMPPYPKLKALSEVLGTNVEEITESEIEKQSRVAGSGMDEVTISETLQANSQRSLFDEDYPFIQKSEEPVLPEQSANERWFKSGDDFPLKDCRILARKIEMHELADGSVYLLVTRKSGVLYRRVYDQTELRGVLVLTPEVTHLSTMDLPLEELVELWEFIVYESSRPPKSSKTNHQLSRLLNEMRSIIDQN